MGHPVVCVIIMPLTVTRLILYCPVVITSDTVIVSTREGSTISWHVSGQGIHYMSSGREIN